MFGSSTTPHRRELEVTTTPQSPVQPVNGQIDTPVSSVPFINLSYNHDKSELSARKLVYKIRPGWRDSSSELEFTKFTDGITNTLLRIARRRPELSQEEVDSESILMRAYGNNTDLIIDRDREAQSHALLAEKGMAPQLLARFENGLLYKFVPGKPCSPEDLTKEPVWRGVAQKLAEWHARIPILTVSRNVEPHPNDVNGHSNTRLNGSTNGRRDSHQNGGRVPSMMEYRSPQPNLWSVLQSWIDVLPVRTEKERTRKDVLQREIERSFYELDTCNAIGEQGFVFGHLDLLSGNVIMLPTKPDATQSSSNFLPVTFIDYEYATPCPAAYDLANHLAEWAGFDLDYSRIPTRSTRRAFLAEYLAAYGQFASVTVDDSLVDSLEETVDHWRGMPGLFWGVWGLIQAEISQIDFDYAQYAEDRLAEYWAWRAETDGSRAKEGKSMPLREQRWAQET